MKSLKRFIPALFLATALATDAFAAETPQITALSISASASAIPNSVNKSKLPLKLLKNR